MGGGETKGEKAVILDGADTQESSNDEHCACVVKSLLLDLVIALMECTCAAPQCANLH